MPEGWPFSVGGRVVVAGAVGGSGELLDRGSEAERRRQES